MACRDAIKKREKILQTKPSVVRRHNKSGLDEIVYSTLRFGVDSKTPANVILQNNLTAFDWVERNKIAPAFWGRYLTGENCLTGEEIAFIHSNGCKIALICCEEGERLTEEQGAALGNMVCLRAFELGAPEDTAIFLEVPEDENTSAAFMKGYAKMLLFNGFIPGFKANTDSVVSFDREFSSGLQTDREIFELCLVWAVAPTLPEYDRMTTTHLLYPDNWAPFAPSGITRKDIAIWQYGKDCHRIYDNDDRETSYNLNLVKHDQVVYDFMY